MRTRTKEKKVGELTLYDLDVITELVARGARTKGKFSDEDMNAWMKMRDFRDKVSQAVSHGEKIIIRK